MRLSIVPPLFGETTRDFWKSKMVAEYENYLSYSQPIVHEWSFPFSRSRLTSVKPSFHLSTSFLPSSPPSSSSSLSLSLSPLPPLPPPFPPPSTPLLPSHCLSWFLYSSIALTFSLFPEFLYFLLSTSFSLTLFLSLPLTLPLSLPFLVTRTL